MTLSIHHSKQHTSVQFPQTCTCMFVSWESEESTWQMHKLSKWYLPEVLFLEGSITDLKQFFLTLSENVNASHTERRWATSTFCASSTRVQQLSKLMGAIAKSKAVVLIFICHDLRAARGTDWTEVLRRQSSQTLSTSSSRTPKQHSRPICVPRCPPIMTCKNTVLQHCYVDCVGLIPKYEEIKPRNPPKYMLSLNMCGGNTGHFL